MLLRSKCSFSLSLCLSGFGQVLVGGLGGCADGDMCSVARYVVASTLLPKSPTHAREFRVPGGVYRWSEIIAAISKASGVDLELKVSPSAEADRLSREAGEKGDVAMQIGMFMFMFFSSFSA